MANTLNGVNLAAIAQASLNVLQARPFLVRYISTNFSNEIAGSGASIATRYVTAPTAQDLSSGYAPTAVTTNAVTVTLNQFYGFVVGLTDTEVSVSAVDIQRLFVRPSAITTVNKVENYIMSLITNANFSQKVTKTSAQFDEDIVADMVDTLRTANVVDDLTLVINPTYYASLLKSGAVKSAGDFGVGAPLATGVVGTIHGCRIVVSTNVPTNSESLEGFLCAPECISVAARAVAVPENFPGQIMNEQDASTGLPVQFRYWYNPDAASQPGSHNFSVGCYYGASKAVVANLIRIVSA